MGSEMCIRDRGCIEQLKRLFLECIYNQSPRLDQDKRFRVDDLELLPEMQAKVEAIWPLVTTDNLDELTDFAAYKSEFLRLFGFGIDGVNYNEDLSPVVDVQF